MKASKSKTEPMEQNNRAVSRQTQKSVSLSSSSASSLSSKREKENKTVWATLCYQPGNHSNFLSDVSISSDAFVIGRRKPPEVHLWLHHREWAEISGKHCRIERELQEEKWLSYVVDTSSNGTFVDNVLVGKHNRVPIDSGSMLSFFAPTSPQHGKLQYEFHEIKAPPPPLEGVEIHNKYTFTSELGSGAFSYVRRATENETGEEWAVKVIDKSTCLRHQHISSSSGCGLLAEVEIIRKLEHNHIVKVHDMFESTKKLCLVLELVDGGDLQEKLQRDGRFEEAECRELFRQVVDAVQYLHVNKVAHRDLKPENILLHTKKREISDDDDDSQTTNKKVGYEAKITDFGVSRIMDKETTVMQTVVGTPLFHAPEMLSSKYVAGGQCNPDGIEYGEGVDVWCLGLILYNMLSGVFPFTNRKPLIDQFPTLLSGLNTAQWDNISDDAKEVVRQCLTQDPKQRISAAGILNGTWLSSSPSLPSFLPPPPTRAGSTSPSYQRHSKRLRTSPSD